MKENEQIFYKRAFWLSLFTIFYNIIEGVVSMALGYADETLSPFGFGADSFIEVLISSLVYELTGFAYADAIGAAGLIYFSVSEGREAFEKAKGKSCSCSEHCEAD